MKRLLLCCCTEMNCAKKNDNWTWIMDRGDCMEHVEMINRELVYEGTILDIYSDTMLLPDGNTEVWDLVHHRKGAAATLAVTDDGKILLVHQYRHALGRYTWEIPAGSRDAVDEDPLICAKRELEEETGFRTDQPLKHLISLKTTVAFCDEFIEVYLATDLKKGEQHLDEAEDIEIATFTVEELTERIYAGEIQDSKTVSAILAYALLQQSASKNTTDSGQEK